MGQHKVKQLHAVEAKLREAAQSEFMAAVRKSNLWERLKFCAKVLFG